MRSLPLSGVRVLDLTQVYARPTCARILCDLGASFAVTLSEAKGLPFRADQWSRHARFFASSAFGGLTLRMTMEGGGSRA